MTAVVVVLMIVVAVLAYAVLIYNRLVTRKNEFLNAYSQIDVQLQRRYELIPNLVESARAYLAHESDTLSAVTEARNQAEQRSRAAARHPEDASLVGQLARAEGVLGGALGKLNVVMEAYPDLKADQTIADLHGELSSTENRVGFARQAYSDAVMRYNTARTEFPAVLIATMLGFGEADLFEIVQPHMREAVKVSFTKAA